MQQSAANSPSPTSASFAAMLAGSAAPASAAAAGDRASVWSDDDLADDYATLSYERALRAHARYRSPDPSLDPAPPPVPTSIGQEPIRSSEAHQGSPTATSQPASSSLADSPTEAPRNLPTVLDRNLKTASITIRLSQAESAQLRTRAAQAGLTVSAYLRSCTFEAESLRALVKDTMAQLRANSAEAKQPAPNPTANRPARPSLRRWWERLWPRVHAAPQAARL